MTTLTLGLARAMTRVWSAGDEIVVSRMEHDANYTPWVQAARDSGATLRHIEVARESCTLDLDSLDAALNEHTRLVAVGAASNMVGTVNPVCEIVARAHAVGAHVFVDAVHYAPHRLIDVAGWGADFVSCSAYKFFGPHVGILWGRRCRLEELPVYKLRPASDRLPDRWMTGTQNHEGIAGALAAVDYLANLGRSLGSEEAVDRRVALRVAYDAITEYEGRLIARLLKGLAAIPEITVWGITDEGHLDHRLPTISLTHDRIETEDLARQLGELGIFAWHGNYYALELTEALGLEPQGMVRLGLVHYNTMQEVERVIEVFEQIS